MKSTTPIALTETDAAKCLGLSVATLRAWRLQNEGPQYHRFGRAVRYLQSSIDAYIGQTLVKTRPRTGRRTVVKGRR
jgi:predicted DNA-binding transcriptional regulator AlpA